MSIQVSVKCPGCHQSLRFTAPQNPTARAACPECGRTFNFRVSQPSGNVARSAKHAPAAQPLPAEEIDLSSESSASFPAATPPAYLSGPPPRQASSPSHQGFGSAHNRKQSWVLPTAIVGGATALLLLFGVLGYAAWRFSGDLLSSDAWFRPTLSSTVANLQNIGQQWDETIRGIEKEEDLDEAIERVKKLNHQLWEMAFRSGQIEPIPGEQIEEMIGEAHRTLEATAQKEQASNPLDRLKDTGLWRNELGSAKREFQMVSLQQGEFLAYGIRQLREPEGKVERLERDYIERLRRYVQTLAEIDSQDDLSGVAPAIEQLADQMYELAEQRVGLTEGFPKIATDYQSIYEALEGQRELQEKWIAKIYQPDLEFAVAIADFARGEAAFSRASWNLKISSRDKDKIRQQEQDKIAKLRATAPVEQVARANTPPEATSNEELAPPASPPKDPASRHSDDDNSTNGANARDVTEQSADDAASTEEGGVAATGTSRSRGFEGRRGFGSGQRFPTGRSSGPGNAGHDSGRTDRYNRREASRAGRVGPDMRAGPAAGHRGGPSTDGDTAGWVVIEIVGGESLDASAIIKQMRESLQADGASFSASNGKRRMVIRYDGDFQQVVDAVDFGEVTKTDEANRRLQVTVR